MNRVSLVGRLARDPELRYTSSSQAMCSFILVLSKGLGKQKEEEYRRQNKPTADFPRIIVWGISAENCSKYLQKGSYCAVEGRIQTGTYIDKQGNTVYTTDVVADRVEFIGTSSQNRYSPQKDFSQSESKNTQNFDEQSNFNSQSNDSDYFDDDFTEIDGDDMIQF